MKLMEIKNALTNYAEDVKAVGKDFVSPYRHFIHWNLSKVAIFAYSALVGLLFSIPFLLLVGGVIFYALSFPAGEATSALVLQKSLNRELIGAVLIENGWKVILLWILFSCVLATLVLFVTYGYFWLLANVYRSYLEGRELPILKNSYFDWRRVWKFFTTTGWSVLYSSVPSLMLALLIIGIGLTAYFLKWKVEDVSFSVGAVVAVALVACLVGSVYMMLRTGFAAFELLADETAESNGREHVRKSMLRTKGKTFRTLMLILPFLIVSGCAEGIVNSVDQNLAVERMYAEAVKMKEKSAKDETDTAFLTEHVRPGLWDFEIEEAWSILSSHKADKDGLDKAFFSQMAPFLERSDFDPSWQVSEVVVNIVWLLFLDGLFVMAYYSAFIRTGGKLRNGGKTEASAESEETSEVPAEKPKKPAVKKAAPKKEKPEEKPATAKKAPAKKPAAKKPVA